jgi:lauroyl/myristoyl acyltransferase
VPEADEQLVRALAQVERPDAHLLEPTGRTLLLRAYASPLFHRALPTGLALRLAALRGRLEWRLVPRRRAEASSLGSRVTGSPAESRAAIAFAKRRLVEDAMQAELQWRPWHARRMAIVGLEHLDAARAGGRGVILATAHLGPFLSLVFALASRGVKVYLSGGHRPDDEFELHGRQGVWTAAQNRWVEESGARWVHRGGSYPLLRELLRRGEVVWMAGDAPGNVEVDYGGRPARIRTGVGVLALDTRAAVVPAFALRRGSGQIGLLLEPIEPADYDQPEDLSRTVARELGRVVSQEVEQAHMNVFWLWAAASGDLLPDDIPVPYRERFVGNLRGAGV